jgi:DNA-binding transcriptional regulator YiaG
LSEICPGRPARLASSPSSFESRELVTIENLPDLFIAIAFKLVEKPEALTGPEMRFLRKRMKMTQSELAAEFRVDEQTIANYEKGKTKPGPADKALRMLFLAHVHDDEEVADELREMAIELMRPPSRRAFPIAARRGHWQADPR